MIIRIVAFTKKGWKLAEAVADAFPEHIWERRDKEDLREWVKSGFELRAPIVFVGATGIAVRAIAPFASDKLQDSPVLVLDEMGQFVIPLLSGHVGGANLLARQVEERLGLSCERGENHYSPKAVLTTATDVNHMFSVDVFAEQNGLEIINRSGIKEVSKKVLEGKQISLVMEDDIDLEDKMPVDILVVYSDSKWLSYDLEDRAKKETGKYPGILLRIKPYVLGIGCKKGTDAGKLRKFVEKYVDMKQVSMVASIDLKQKEYGLVQFCQQAGVKLVTYDANTLQQVEGDFSESDFVKTITGVSNVCERVAMVAAGKDGVLLQKKISEDGMTLAMARREVHLQWER